MKTWFENPVVPLLIILYGSVRAAVCESLLSPPRFWGKVKAFMDESLPDAPPNFQDQVATFMRSWSDEPARHLCYLKCDDWFIYAKDANGKVYSLCTELWPEWADLHQDADQEDDAIERYMLPIARATWAQQPWQLCPDLEVEARAGVFGKAVTQ